MANNQELIRMTACMRRRRGIMSFVLIILHLLDTMVPSPPRQIITYSWMGTTLLQMLDYAPDVTWRNLFRLDRRTFRRLAEWLATNTDLGNLTGLPLRRKMVIFLLVVGHGYPIRLVATFVGCSWDTAHRLV